ncbi:hypothetical protein Psfp_01710 [Pelotomaculum sp. FP]|uniref:hypothetical protein n=1 Tax=Pelotomaculum sp. FP TaxID=261474 RepID=UPI0011023E1D|nr:hypothetical protein [Pelotomaculum sp. FP]TEB15934.1 hypothetical protein Psfp_01710 [Pelotomaculum sp. FP]
MLPALKTAVRLFHGANPKNDIFMIRCAAGGVGNYYGAKSLMQAIGCAEWGVDG